MADYTYTHRESVMGDSRVQMGTLTLTDGPTCVINTGMNHIYGGSVTAEDPVSATGGLNVNTSAVGSFMIPTGVSGAIYNTVIFGR